ncbi:MAG TPA: hypothetical protein VHI93_08065, partial [Candidatus Thermoplasmatota archaeon]|nr:hypothetical protein [Candidatus Thermoplasmatota archaeon]
SSGPSGSGFSIEAPKAPGGAYTFTSDVAADNYTWDLGDRLSVAYGKTVTHAYDLKDAALTVTLRATTAGVAREYSQPLVVGSGQNAKATFLMEAETDWAVTGETVRFSAARSFDPEGDPLRFSWSCLRTADAERKPPHVHPVIGQPFASPPAGSVTTGKTNRTLPAPDHTFDGDLCDALGSGTRMGTGQATIAGTFTRTGIYSLYLLASDGAHPTTSGEFKFYVTPPNERPAPTFVRPLNVTLQGGIGALQQVCSHEQNPAQQTCDQASMRFDLPLGATQMLVNVSHTTAVPEPAGSAATRVSWEILRGDSVVASGSANPEQVAVNEPAKLGAGAYTARVTLEHGAQVEVLLTVFVRLDMDPGKVY